MAIETSRGLLVSCLRGTGRKVYAINPLAVARYRERHTVARSKSDHADAMTLANILRVDAAHHRPLPADSELVQAIAVLARAQQDAVWNRQQLANQLRSLVNPAQALRLLDAVPKVGRKRGPRLKALFACIYYAALRPEEVADLRLRNCSLPELGWGLLVLERARPQGTKRWTNSGATHESRSLKHRADKETREIPIPPILVAMLREHIAEYGTAKDGRIFSTGSGGSYSSSAHSYVWQEARKLALTPEQVSSSLATRPYDLRHAAVSLWLNAGVPAPEVAKRAGHSVDVLLRVYAKCMDGQKEQINGKINDALNE